MGKLLVQHSKCNTEAPSLLKPRNGPKLVLRVYIRTQWKLWKEWARFEVVSERGYASLENKERGELNGCEDVSNTRHISRELDQVSNCSGQLYLEWPRGFYDCRFGATRACCQYTNMKRRWITSFWLPSQSSSKLRRKCLCTVTQLCAFAW